MLRHRLLTSKLIKQGFRYNELRTAFKRFAKNAQYCFKNMVLVYGCIYSGGPLEVRNDLVSGRGSGCVCGLYT